MLIFKVNIPEEVFEEIELFFDYIAADSIEQAIKWQVEIEEKIYTLRDSPARCPYADEMAFHDYEIRNLICGNYRVLFHINEHTVQVLHVKHGKMNRVPLDEN